MEKSDLAVMGLLLILKLRHAIEARSGGSIRCLLWISILLRLSEPAKQPHLIFLLLFQIGITSTMTLESAKSTSKTLTLTVLGENATLSLWGAFFFFIPALLAVASGSVFANIQKHNHIRIVVFS
jgi:hypothetical protein